MNPHPERETTSLLVEGGGLRGAFTAGVLAQFGRAGTHFDDIVAVSSAAPTAAYLMSGQVEAGLGVWRDHTHGERLVSPFNWLRGRPLMDIDGLIDIFKRVVPLDLAAFARSTTRLWVSVTERATGEPHYLAATPSNIFELLRATMALPLAYGKAVRIGGIAYVDGGVAEPLPFRHALSFNHARIVMVLTHPRGYRRKPSRFGATFNHWSHRRHPAVGRALSARGARGNASLDVIDALEDAGEIEVIRPPVTLPAARLSRSRRAILETLEVGFQAGRDWLARNAR